MTQALDTIRIYEGTEFPNDARGIHEFLGSKQEFSTWIRNRIKKYGFEEGEDFLINLSKSQKGRPSKEYHVSDDMAKELGMIENTSKGRAMRKFFIAIEKQHRATIGKGREITPAEQLLQNAQILVEQERILSDHENRIQQIEAKGGGSGFFSILGWCNVLKIRRTAAERAAMSRIAWKKCQDTGSQRERVDDERYGHVWGYPVEVLEDLWPQ